MRTFFSLFLCLITRLCIAQVIVDPGVVKRYNEAYAKLPTIERQRLDISQRMYPQVGLAFFIKHTIDTLNEDDRVKPDPNQLVTSFKEGPTVPYPLHVSLIGDTLTIDCGFLYPRVIHKLFKNKTQTYYEIFEKRDTVYRLTLTKNKTNSLKVPGTTMVFKLSKTDYKVGEVIYGEISYTIGDHFMDSPSFKLGYLHTRQAGTYLFKAPINNSKHEEL